MNPTLSILTHDTKLMSSMFNIPTDHWIIPNVSGDKPPPVSSFTLSKIANEKVLLYGGNTAEGPSSELRVATVLGESVVSMCVLFKSCKVLNICILQNIKIHLYILHARGY